MKSTVPQFTGVDYVVYRINTCFILSVSKKYINIRAVAHLLCIYAPTFNVSFLYKSWYILVYHGHFDPFSSLFRVQCFPLWIVFECDWISIFMTVTFNLYSIVSFFSCHFSFFTTIYCRSFYIWRHITKQVAIQNSYNISYRNWWRPSNPSIIRNCNDFDSNFNRFCHRRINDNFILETYIDTNAHTQNTYSTFLY